MSRDGAIIEGLVRSIQDECRFCHCHGDECKTEDGDLCCWLDGLRTACSGVACKKAYYLGKTRAKEAMKRVRRVRRGGRAA